jgi:hypothetical protein
LAAAALIKPKKAVDDEDPEDAKAEGKSIDGGSPTNAASGGTAAGDIKFNVYVNYRSIHDSLFIKINIDTMTKRLWRSKLILDG